MDDYDDDDIVLLKRSLSVKEVLGPTILIHDWKRRLGKEVGRWSDPFLTKVS